MSFEGFYNNCLRAAHQEYARLLKTPRGRAVGLSIEVKEIIKNIKYSIRHKELPEQIGKNLIKEFEQIDFDSLTKDRAEMKKQLKKRERDEKTNKNNIV